MSKKVWILSMDGGGVRSSSSLLILQSLLKTCWPGQEAHEVFQVTYGTSGGGLCSLMLGRLKMSITEAIDCLESVSRRVFTSSWSLLRNPWENSVTLLGRATGGLLWWPRHASRMLRDAIQGTINGTMGDMQSHSSNCQSYVVCSWRKPSERVVGLHLKTFGDALFCPVWKAGLATSSAPTFFDPVVVDYPDGPRRLQDGGLGRNNPIETFELFELDTFPNSNLAEDVRLCYVSIGTGKPTARQKAELRRFWRYVEYFKFWKYPQRLLQSTALAQATQLALEVATDTEGSHEQFYLATRRRKDIRYFRFNCNDRLPEIALDKADSLDEIRRLTLDYLGSEDFVRERDRLQTAISEP